jgi:ABC-type phosphate transport system substrate-binding protein
VLRVLTMVRLRRAVLAILVAAAFVAPPGRVCAQAGKEKASAFTVVINAENPATELSMQDLTRIYLGKKTLWDSGARIQAGMLETDTPVIRDFVEKDMQRTLDQYRAYWKQMLFSGGGTAPRTFRTTAQVVEFVSREPGAIGIILGPPTDEHVKVIEVRGAR